MSGKCAAWRVLADVRGLPAAEAVTELGKELCWKPAPRAAGGSSGAEKGPGTAVVGRSSPTASSSALQRGQKGVQVSAEVSMAHESCQCPGDCGVTSAAALQH